MALADIIDKVIDIVKVDTNLKGTYWGDQMGYSAYPVACVASSLLEEEFPVIARQLVRDEKYTVEIIIYVKLEDTLANCKSIITLTDTMRAALRGDLTLGDYVYQSKMGASKFLFWASGNILLRFSVTTVEYIKRIG